MHVFAYTVKTLDRHRTFVYTYTYVLKIPPEAILDTTALNQNHLFHENSSHSLPPACLIEAAYLYSF